MWVTSRAVPRLLQSAAFKPRLGGHPLQPSRQNGGSRLSYPSLLDPGTDFAQQYGVRALPETFFIDREGRIRAIARGELTADFLARSLKRTGYTGPGSAR
jgi:hypothetical protein